MINKLPVIILIAFFGSKFCQAQLVITKENGESFMLGEKADWKPINDAPDRRKLHSFRIPFGSTMLIEGMNKRYGIRYNPEKWEVLRGPNYQGSDFYNFEFEFYHRAGEGFGLIIADTTQRQINEIIDHSLSRIKAASTEFHVTYGEIFRVNRKMIYMVMIQAIQRGIKINYYNYYYSGEEGSYQLLTYCAQKTFIKYEDDFKDLLNGFISL